MTVFDACSATIFPLIEGVSRSRLLHPLHVGIPIRLVERHPFKGSKSIHRLAEGSPLRTSLLCKPLEHMSTHQSNVIIKTLHPVRVYTYLYLSR